MSKIAKFALFVAAFALALAIAAFLVVVQEDFGKVGAYIDSNQITTFTDVNVDNDLVVDGAFTTAGAVILSGTTTISGAPILSYAGAVKVNAATSTLQIGDTTSGIGTGCLVLGDSAASTTKPVYITATGATITATTTKPAICR